MSIRVSDADLSSALRVVAIGVDLPAPTAVRISHWDDIPAASVDYAAAHGALERHVAELLTELSRE